MESVIHIVLVKLLMLHVLSSGCASSSTTNSSTDMLALLALKSQIKLPSNSSIVSSWKPNTSFCNWVGVSCSHRHQRVAALNLSYMRLQGTISPHVGNLTFLRVLNLRNNSFHGPLPNTVGRLRRLRVINLAYNQFGGTIPSSISQCQNLQMIILGPNLLQGSIPEAVGNLTNLLLLQVQFNDLVGTIPSSVFNISTLKGLALSNNRISGSIPLDICRRLQNLELLYLSHNPLSGHVPKSLCLCRNLRELELLKNGLTGSIPTDLGCLSQLEYLNLRANQLTGIIPTSLSNLSRLEELNLASNSLSGEIPSNLGNLSNLEELCLTNNRLSGEIPPELGQLSNLIFFEMANNYISGRLPQVIFNLSSAELITVAGNNLSGNVPKLTVFQLQKLRQLSLHGNRFTGRIPDSISNASMLSSLELSTNLFSGPVPRTLGSLRYLKTLNVQNNKLTNDPSQRELNFLTALTECRQLKYLMIGYNPFNGALPESIGNLSTSLELFSAAISQLQGSLPYQIGNLSSLLTLELSDNHMIGAFPSSIGNLRNLQMLYFRGNKIEGNLPNELCQSTSLGELGLDENELSGPIPSCIGNLTNMLTMTIASNAFTSIPDSMWRLSHVWFMDFSVNSLSGHLPSKIEKLVQLQTLDLSKNKLSGSIPETLSNLKMLEQLNLSNNAFQGNIPSSIGDLASLELLDLSFNNFSGSVPLSLEKLTYLKHLNLSFNSLSGPVPTNRAFGNFTIQSFMGNHDLCGNSKLKLPPCPNATHPKSRKVTFWLKCVLSPIAALILGVLLLILYVKFGRKSKNLPVSSIDESIKLGLKYISYYELLGATNNLNEANLLGTGSFGSVYKGTMTDGEIVAVKVFDLQVEGAITSFDRECQVLRNIRHRNLVKIISSCSNLDFRALVLQYMPNGSLEKWLYNRGPNCLDFLQRMDIVIDVAFGLEYLHHGYSEPIVHCDLKPSNVLLDEDMVAHIGDFGIARILAKYKSMTQTATFGTMGYIAPEFGLQGRVTPKGDVYSFGIILLEIFTRKNPRDEMFVEGLNLRQWIICSYPDHVTEIMDASLLIGYEEATVAAMDSLTHCFSSIIELALQCSSDSPEERLNMIDVVAKLKKIKHDMVQHNRFNGQ